MMGPSFSAMAQSLWRGSIPASCRRSAAVAQLLGFLAEPGDGTGEKGSLRRNACWLTYLTAAVDPKTFEAIKTEMAAWQNRLPPFVKQQPRSALMMSQPASKLSILGWWPGDLIKTYPPLGVWSAPGIVAIDEAQQTDEADLQRTWRQWLQVFNILQSAGDAASHHDQGS